MDDSEGRRDPVNYYGPWAWIAGYALAAFVIWVLFAYAVSFG